MIAARHLYGAAFDIAMANHDPEAFKAVARAWHERFQNRQTPLAVETPPAREPLAESRTMKGGGVAGVATIGAAGVEIARDVLAETRAAVPPLVPYLDALR
jgi:hypothetical protein